MQLGIFNVLNPCSHELNQAERYSDPSTIFQLLGLESPIRGTINCAEVACFCSHLVADKSLR